jgi:hypothetical protein
VERGRAEKSKFFEPDKKNRYIFRKAAVYSTQNESEFPDTRKEISAQKINF